MAFCLISAAQGPYPLFLTPFLESGELVEVKSANDTTFLLWQDGQLSLHCPPLVGGLTFDFDVLWKKLHKTGLPAGPLTRACRGARQVYDLTCGTGHDSLYFLALGKEVFSWERALPLYLLLCDARRRVQGEKLRAILANWQISYGEWSGGESSSEGVLLYYDPMFVPAKRKGLPNKAMQFFDALLGAGEMGENEAKAFQLYQLARQKKARKLLIKRSLKAAPLLQDPHTSYTGKTVRYDSYTL